MSTRARYRPWFAPVSMTPEEIHDHAESALALGFSGLATFFTASAWEEAWSESKPGDGFRVRMNWLYERAERWP